MPSEAATSDHHEFIFVGTVRPAAGRLDIDGPAGTVRVQGSESELAHVAQFLNNPPIQADAAPDATLSELLTAIESVGAVLVPSRAWSWFQMMSANPPVVPVDHDPMAAYAMPRARAAGTPMPNSPSVPGDLPPGPRRSADLATVRPDHEMSFDAALTLARSSYRLDVDGHRPVASGGALYPLQLWVIGSASPERRHEVIAVDHDEGTDRQQRELGTEDLQQMFVPDSAVSRAIAAGAAVIVVGADPRRMTHKYGNRGWRYTLMEAGAVGHHISMTAAACHVAVRPIGGYYDDRLFDTITSPLLPLHVLIVSKDSS